MLEGVLARFLSSRVGRFVDGVDQQNLNVALWKGEILLQDLRVKPSAVDECLGLLPLALDWGHVGTFHLSVPWNALGSKPLVITLKDVTLVFRLLTERDMEEEGKEGGAGLEGQRRRRAAKEQAVQERLKFLQAAKAAKEGEGDLQQQQQLQQQQLERRGLAERLFASMLENVQVRLSGVHVRIEGMDGREIGVIEEDEEEEEEGEFAAAREHMDE